MAATETKKNETDKNIRKTMAKSEREMKHREGREKEK